MNNLHRHLAPVSTSAWEQIEDEARRTFKRNVAARRVVDVSGPHGVDLAAVGSGHLNDTDSHVPGVDVRLRDSQPLVELRVLFTLAREAVDSVERGSQDADWQPVKDAATDLALAEDRAIIDGFAPASIGGIRPGSSNAALPLPADSRELPDAVAQAASVLRLAGVDGPYSLLVSASTYTTLAETTDNGNPILRHVQRLLGDGGVLWAPAIDGALLLSGRGGDYELTLGEDVAIGYQSHDQDTVTLYLQESMTFRAFTAEASVSLDPVPAASRAQGPQERA